MPRAATALLLLGTSLPIASATAQEGADVLRAVPFPQVVLRDPFFAPRRATNTKVTLAHALDQLEATGTLGNFDLAAAGARRGYRGFVFQDSDAYKALEAVAYALGEHRDAALDARLDAIIARIAKAQRPDGYLNTSYTVEARGERFHNLRDDHELYCAGHLFEAAVAHVQATGKRTLLDVATRYADLLVRTFGRGEGQRPGYCGHPGIELALVKLARTTGDDNYLMLAQHFVATRGSRFFAKEHGEDPATWDGRYWLDHEPVQQMQRIAGHAVRAAYLMAGAADVAAATGDEGLLQAVRRVWRNTVEQNVFVTGGIGPSASNEGFTTDFDLPTHSAYQESCASIALVLWAHRLNLVTRDAAYADAIEQALYNAIPAGVQLDGTKFFYVNPLASHGSHHRRGWFGCACCPPNLARTFAAVSGYVAAAGHDALYTNLYAEGEVVAQLGVGKVGLVVTTAYPWQGDVVLRIVEAPSAPWTWNLRIPAWCDGAQVVVPDAPEPVASAPGYFAVHRTWRRGDEVRLSLPMPVRTLVADPRAEALRGRVAFARGPIVYCTEQVDVDAPLDELVAPPGTTWTPVVRQDLLGGVTVLTGTLQHAPSAPWSGRHLYHPSAQARAVAATLVPYAVWDNRAAGPMAVWLPQAPPPPRRLGCEQAAAVAMSFQHDNCVPDAVRDGVEPERSGDTPPQNCHFWPHKGGTEWVQYTWTTPQELTGCRVFWFDDTGRGECRLPAAARLSWRSGERWVPVEPVGGAGMPIAADRWCELTFAPVRTTALRLEVDQQPGHASGVLEWRVDGADDRR